MILCITPNPALDRFLTIPELSPGEVHRANSVQVAPGGKGLNVARVARALGAEVKCGGLLGGDTGQLLAELAKRAGLPGAWTWIAGETRTCTILVDARRGETTVINEPGPMVAGGEWRRLQTDMLREAAGASCVCVSGSLPPGVPENGLADIVRGLGMPGRPVWLDSSGAALGAAMASVPLGLKINAAEAAALLGWSPFNDMAAALRAAQELQRLGVPEVAVTLGSRGAVLVTMTGAWQAAPPPLHVVSAVGSGDAFLAGLVTARVAGEAPPDQLRRAVAAGSAYALSLAGQSWMDGDFARVLAGSTVVKVGA